MLDSVCKMIRFQVHIIVLTYVVYRQRDWAVPDGLDQASPLFFTDRYTQILKVSSC